MAVDTQMYTHIFDAVKGWYGGWVVDFQAPLSDNVTVDVYAGRCMHINDDGEFELGAVGDQMPIFCTSPSTAPSVGNPSPSGYWYGINGGILSGVCSISGVEIETTEYDTAQTYLPNQQLRAIAANGNQTTGGRLTNQGVVKVASGSAATATAVVGVVSKAPHKQSFEKPNVLSFWAIYSPGAAGL